MEGEENCPTSEVSTVEVSCEQESSEAKNELESKSADDILNELFTELGSKNFTESVADFLKTPSKKKKKHKEKKEIKKQKSKSKKKKKNQEESSPKKRNKSDGDEQVGSDREGISEKQSRTEKKKSSKTKEYTNNEREKDVEEGEIIEKHSGSHHRTKSSHKETSSNRHPKSAAWISPTHDKDFGDEGRSRDRREEDNYIEGRRLSIGEREYLRSRSRSPRGDRDVSHGSRSRSRHEYPDHDKRRRDFDRSPPGYRGDDESRHHASRNSRRRSPPPHNRRQRHDSRSDFRSRRFIPEHDRRRIAPPYRRSRSRSRSYPRYGSEVIDKEKLLEIARRNASVLMKKGVLPTDIFSKDQIVAIKAGGKSVEDLTAYCRKIAAKDAKRGDGDLSDDDGLRSDEGEAEHFIHHPFVVKERPMPQITLNIRNAIPLPVRTPQELAIENAVRKSQFPVSSGCQHRFKELEWKEVDEDQDKNKCKLVATVAPTPAPALVETPEPETEIKPVPPVDQVPSVPPKDTGISLEPPALPQVDIGSVISARLKAMRALKENPECQEAKKELDSALVEMEQWAQAKALEPKFLSVSDLTSGPQAWAKRDQLKNAKQVASGMGMHLLQKMGWRPGEGLGKNKEGTTEPLALDVKTDKKGLMSQADLKVKGPQANVSMLYDLSGKHPVSALMELCTKRRWGPPVFDLCFEHGPPHQKSFVFKVTVNGVEYQPCIATNNKKLAKANAAAFCLQSLGLLKPAATSAPAETLQTVPGPAAASGSTAGAAGMRMVPSHLLQTVPSYP